MSDSYLFENATLIDINHKAQAGFSVLVENDKIKAVEQGKIESKAKRIDAKGKYLLPGLIDAHIHLSFPTSNFLELGHHSLSYRAAIASRNTKRLLQRGFTTVRDAAGTDIGFVNAVDEDVIQGPRIFTACNIISKTGGHGDTRLQHSPIDTCPCSLAPHRTVLTADGIDGVRKAARETLRRGAHQIKIATSGGVLTERNSIHAPQFSLEEIKAIVDEANDSETYVMAHAHGWHGIRRAIEAGVRTIEHCSFLDGELADLMLKHNTYMSPTLTIGDLLANDKTYSKRITAKAQDALDASLHSVKLAIEAGINIGFGTDVFGDLMDHQGNEFLIRSKLQDNYSVIVSATATNAEMIQQKNKLGVIKEEAFADVILVDKNPLDDISVLADKNGKHISLVMKGGKLYKS